MLKIRSMYREGPDPGPGGAFMLGGVILVRIDETKRSALTG